MLANVHTILTGWDVVVALLVLLVGIALERLIPPHPWVLWLTLVAVVLFGCALTVRF